MFWCSACALRIRARNAPVRAIYRQVAHIPAIAFRKKVRVTLLIVAPFDRWDAEDLDEARIKLNFVETVVSIFPHFKNRGSEIKVVCKNIERLKYQPKLVYDEDEDLTWKAELAAEVYAPGAYSIVMVEKDLS